MKQQCLAVEQELLAKLLIIRFNQEFNHSIRFGNFIQELFDTPLENKIAALITISEGKDY